MAEKFVIYLLHKILSFSSEFILLDVTFSYMKLLYVDLLYYCFDSIYRFFFSFLESKYLKQKLIPNYSLLFFCYVHFTWATALKKCIQDADKLHN